MHYYQHHIGDFNSATRHLTRVERSLYRDLIELYYDREKPFDSANTDRLQRRVLAHTDEEKAALQYILDEFFELEGGVYTHRRCEEELEKYRTSTSLKAKAGRASAEARAKKAAAKKAAAGKAENEQDLTPVEHPLNKCPTESQQNPTNHKPITNIHNKETRRGKNSALSKNKFSDDDMKAAEFIWKGVKALDVGDPQPNLETWANTVRLMVERDKRSHKEICEVFQFGNKHHFWFKQVRCPDKLRKKWGDLRCEMKTPVAVAWQQIPKRDDKLCSWAEENGFSSASPGEDFFRYRSRLQGEIRQRQNAS